MCKYNKTPPNLLLLSLLLITRYVNLGIQVVGPGFSKTKKGKRMLLGLFLQAKILDIFQLPPGGTGCTGIN